MTLDQAGDALVTFVREHRTWAAPIVFLLAFGESLAFISLLLPFWGLLVGLGAFIGMKFDSELLIVWTAASIGAALGDWVSFAIGRRYHAEIAQMWPIRDYPDILARGRAFFERWGAWAIAIGRFSGPLRASVPIIAGAADMKPWRFQLANWPSAFLWAGVLLVFGGELGEMLTMGRRMMGW